MFKKEKALFFLTAALTIFPFLPWVPLRTAQRPVRTDTAQPVDFDALRQMSDICQCFYTGWVNIGDKTLYFTGGMPADGVVATEDFFMRFQHGEPNPGWEDGMMFFDDNGRAVTGLYEIEGTVFLFDDNGRLMDGIVSYNGDTYCSTPDGIKTGWADTGNGKEYFLPDGKRAEGITQIDGIDYVLSEDGEKFTAGVHIVDGKEYSIGNQGEMQSGFVQTGSRTVYAYPEGGIAKGVSIIDGKEYLFNQEGTLIRNGWSDGKYAGDDGVIMKSCVVNGTVLGPDGNEMPNYGYGNGGRLFIPDVGVNVALQYDCSDMDVNQSICNAQDTALFYHACTYANDCIADHKHQGFNAIIGCVPGETMAYILHADGTVIAYRCVGNTEGTNTGETVFSNNGMDILDHSSYDLQMYTCLEHWTHVRITFWERI